MFRLLYRNTLRLCNNAAMPSRRADARRNRARVMAVTRQLVDQEGPHHLRVAEVARLAGVGPGTVYRAFGDKAGLLLALLDDDERRLQELILRGPPPLGPGASPDERLQAFMVALFDLTARDRHILLAADAGDPAGRFRTGVHDAWVRHVTMLLSSLRPAADARLLAELLLAALSPGLLVMLLEKDGDAEGRLRDEVRALARAVGRPEP